MSIRQVSLRRGTYAHCGRRAAAAAAAAADPAAIRQFSD